MAGHTDGVEKTCLASRAAVAVIVVALAAVIGCGGPATNSAASKSKPKKKPAQKQPSGASQPAVSTNPQEAGQAHPTDALTWKDDGEARVAPTGPDARPQDSAEPEASADGDPANDAAPPTEDSGDGKNEKPDANAKRADGVDLASAERKLNEAKSALAANEGAANEGAEEKDKEQFFSDALMLIDDAIAADDFALAGRVVAVALEFAPSLADSGFGGEAAKAKRKLAQFEAAYKRATAAREQLAANPNDGAAHSSVGGYLCYLQGKWDEGLPHLVKSEDAAAVKAATLDLAAPTTTDERQAVADAWWTVAGRQDGVAKAQVMLRARHWYDKIRRAADVETQEKLRIRMEMIDKFAVSSGVNVALGLEAEAADVNGKLSPTQRGRVQQLLIDFRRAAGNPQRLETIGNKLVQIGGPAVSQMLVEVNKQLQPQLQRYGQEFQEQARAVQASRGGANTAEVERLRAQVLALKEMPNLTKDMIVQQGDPAMAKLTEMLVVQPQMVLEKSTKLREERSKLLAIGRQWERAQQYLIAGLQQRESKDKEKRGNQPPGANRQAGGANQAGANAAPADAAETAPPPPPNFAKYLEGEEELATKMVMPMDDKAREVLAANAKLIGKIETEEARAILACNLMRQLLGLNVLKIDLKLCDAARDHSKDMATLNFFAHESPVPGKTTPWDRAKNFNTTASAENIAFGMADGNAANLGWFHSPGHHKNMLGSHERIGLGVHNSRYTEMFGR